MKDNCYMARFIPLLVVLMMVTAACKSDQAKINDLLDHIKMQNTPWEDPEALAALIKLGCQATPAVLAEFERAHEAEFSTLTEVLVRIPSPARNAAFLKMLDRYNERSKERFFNEASTRMIDALAADHYTTAVPAIRKLAGAPATKYDSRDFDGDRNEIRSHAVAALNVLGQPLPSRPDAEVLTIAPEAAMQVADPAFADVLPVFKATLDQTLQNASSTSTLALRSVKAVEEVNGDPSMMPESFMSPHAQALFEKLNTKDARQYEFNGSFTMHKGAWQAMVVLFGENEALVFASYNRGPVWGRGYTGRVEKREGRWLIVEWQMIWLS